MTQTRLKVVPAGAVPLHIIDAINEQRRIANVILLATIGAAHRGGDLDGIEDICDLHIDALKEIAEALGEK